jgi:hypothetical protein
MLPSGNNRGNYISSGPKIPNCTYTIVSAIKFKRMKAEEHIPPLCAEAAPKTVRLLRTGLPLCEFNEEKEVSRRYPAYRSLSRRRVAVGAEQRRLRDFLKTC